MFFVVVVALFLLAAAKGISPPLKGEREGECCQVWVV